MTAREMLQELRDLSSEMNKAFEKAARIRSQAVSLASPMGKEALGGTGSKDPHRDGLLIKLADQEARAKEIYNLRYAKVRKVRSVLDDMENARLAYVLRLRYVSNLRWTDVCEFYTEHISPVGMRQIYRMHGDALIQFGEVLRKRAERAAGAQVK